MTAKQALDTCRWLQDQRAKLGLKPSTLQVAHAIAHRANANNQAWPSLSTLAEDTGLHRATVARALHALEDAGLIERERRQRTDGGNTSTRYRIVRPGEPTQPRLPLGAVNRSVNNPRAEKEGLVASCDNPSRMARQASERDHTNEGSISEEIPAPTRATVDSLPRNLRDIVLKRLPHLASDQPPTDTRPAPRHMPSGA